MIKLKQAVIVEGRYDKIKLSSLIDAPIIETNGFRIFKDKEKQNLIRLMAEKRGILILTDSDSAGFVIRNFLKGIVKNGEILNAYIPQLSGKEKRKEAPSKEGFLGVEGLDGEVLLKALQNSGADCAKEESDIKAEITKQDLYLLGLSGKENSAVMRQKLLKRLSLPCYMTANAMTEALNCLVTKSELIKLCDDLKGEI